MSENVKGIRQNHKIHHGNHEKQKVKLLRGEKTLAEVKSQREISPGDTLSPLRFVIVVISFNTYIRRKCTRASNLQNHKKILISLSSCLQKKKGKELEILIRTIRIHG